MTENREDRARERAQIIMQVRSGMIEATEGSKLLHISRKTYYEWEKRGLTAMLKALEDGDAGRPPQESDPRKEALEQRVKELERELTVAKQTIEVKRLLDAYQQQHKQLQSGSATTSKKNKKSGKQ